MPLFDRYIAVDWSANNSPKGRKDSIWIGEASSENGRISLVESINPRTRQQAMDHIVDLLRASLRLKQRTLVGFDFPFGFPAGAAKLIAGSADWRQVWELLYTRVTDDKTNASNRFEVAAQINEALKENGPIYWGHPDKRTYANLRPDRKGLNYSIIAEKRIVERREGAKSAWQLSGAGNVGGQAITGMARLAGLLRESSLHGKMAVWPFETEFARNLLAPIIVAEIYPSLFEVDPDLLPADQAQVEALAHGFAELDLRGKLNELLSAPHDLSVDDCKVVLREEGWIVGAGHKALRKSVSLPGKAKNRGVTAAPYLRDPDLIYAQSFATIRAEADLSHLPAELHDAAIRMIHACGMVDLAADILGDPAVVAAVQTALRAGAPVFCDCEMVRAGIIRRHLPEATELLLTLNAPNIAELAKLLATTRSAAAVELWRPRLAGAVVLIGNAPTALFHLLEILDQRGPRPAAIIAAPVGFVGAAESKALLADNRLSIPYLTVRGRRGGSAIASAAFNAISKGLGS